MDAAFLRSHPDLLAMAISESSLDPRNLWRISPRTLLRWGWKPEEFADPEAQLAFMLNRLNRYLALLGLNEWPTAQDAYLIHLLNPVHPVGVIPDQAAGWTRDALMARLDEARATQLYKDVVDGR